MQPKKRQEDVSQEVFLRSINICYDADAPERIEHFHPTTKTVPLLRALLGQEDGRAFFVVAPYGSGKSLTAAYLLHLVENHPNSADMLKAVGTRLRMVSPELGEQFLRRRRRPKTERGCVLALHGFTNSFHESLKLAILECCKRLKWSRQPFTRRPCDNISDAIELLKTLCERAEQEGNDRIVILWDEFGRHLESLVAEGRTAALDDLQSLAEFVSRSARLPITLGLFLHQGLLHYAGSLPQSVRSEWTKIEGRFETIQYVDDSKEIYRLVGEVVSSKNVIPKLSKRDFIVSASKMCDEGFFADATKKEVASLLEACYPLEPMTVYLLPRISARVAQNERTLFDFLYTANLDSQVGVDQLYDFFSPAMRSDTAVGGTHRQWLETQSAISKTAGEEAEIAALKTIALMGLGTGGERSRARKPQVSLAIDGYTKDGGGSTTLKSLIKRKLVLHRKHNDEVAVWHGTDLDLRSRLREEKMRQRDNFDLLAYLSKEAPPPSWKPTEYNDEFHIRRYLVGEYQTPCRLETFMRAELVLGDIPVDCDGKVLYTLPNSSEELEAVEEMLINQHFHQQLIVAIPRQPLALFDAALEAHCLMRLQLDADLIESDPLALAEIRQLADDTRTHLQKLIDQLVWPSPNGPRWFYDGREIAASSPRQLRRELSKIMRGVYCRTPRLNNENIVRKKPSPTLVNSRKKLLLGILERYGMESFGIKGNYPDMSMCRTILVQTGLYKENRGRWGFVTPASIEKDPGLKETWQRLRSFLTKPRKSPKPIAELINSLMLPPLGLRAGVLPILIGSALKAFPSAISLMRKNEYVTDILPTVIEDLCKNPDHYKLLVLDLDDEKSDYLRAVHKQFSTGTNYEVAEPDLIRLCYDAIQSWRSQLPTASMTATTLSEVTSRFRGAVVRQTDPVRLLLEEIPKTIDVEIGKKRKFLNALTKCRKELENVSAAYGEKAASSLNHAIGLGEKGSGSCRARAKKWSLCFSDSFIESMSDGVGKGLLSRMRIDYESDELLINSLGSLLLGKPLSRWEESTLGHFEKELQNVIHRVEEAALTSSNGLTEGAGADGLANLVRGRITELYDRLTILIGSDQASAIMNDIYREKQGS